MEASNQSAVSDNVFDAEPNGQAMNTIENEDTASKLERLRHERDKFLRCLNILNLKHVALRTKEQGRGSPFLVQLLNGEDFAIVPEKHHMSGHIH